MYRLLFIAMFLVMGCALSAATTVSADITSDTTWNNAGSPYRLQKMGMGGNFAIRNGATLTIDSSGGPVDVEWISWGNNADFDLNIGNGSTEQGTLIIKASSGAVTFKVKTGGNIRVKNNGQLRWSDATAATTFTRYSTQTWGALIFESGQTRQSEVRNSVFSYGGNDSKTAMIVVEDSETYVPYLENLTFTNQATSGVAAVRMNGKGINTLKQGNVVMPFSTTTDYVFYINAVTSTSPTIRYPDVDSPDTPTNYLAGTCTVGDASNVSHWRFDDGYTFKCANSSLVNVVRGSIWGTVETRPTFRSVNASPTFTNWTGLRDNQSSYGNIYGGVGPFAFVTVRDASFGVDVDKYTGSPIAGEVMRLPGIHAFHCDYGVRLKSSTDGTIRLENADLGHASSSAEYNQQRCVHITGGDAEIADSMLRGTEPSGFFPGRVLHVGGGSIPYSVRLERNLISGQGQYGIYMDNPATSGDLSIDRCQVLGAFSVNTTYLLSSVNVGRTLTIKNSLLGGYAALVLNHTHASTPTFNVLVEDTTFVNDSAGTSYGLYGSDIPASPSSVVCRRCSFYGRTYGAYIPSDSSNLCEYTFEECYFTGNTYGIRDLRAQTARCILSKCTLQGNGTSGAHDDNGGGATTNMLAENCYWGAPNGPSGSGPGSGDAVNANVDYDPFLDSPYFDFLIGGCPAGASKLEVRETATTKADHLHLITNRPYFVWEFASDFAGLTQSAYEVEVSSSPTFGSFMWDGSKTTSAATNVQYPTTGGGVSALVDGTTYYVRIRLWNQYDRVGPWYYRTFRLNTAPPQVSNTNRTPGDSSPTGDWTPVFVWERPVDADEDPLHFEVVVDDPASDRKHDYYVYSWTLSEDTYAPATIDVRPYFQLSTDGGTTWLPFPSDGAPAGETTLVRLIWPDAFALPNDTWDWWIRAYDGFEFSTASTTWDFTLTRSYTISGRLLDNAGDGLNGKTVRLYVNGVDSGDTDDTAADVVDGRFDIVCTEALEVGDVLWVYVDDETEKAAAVFHFTGEDITYDDDSADIVLRAERVYVYATVSDLAYDNEAFSITTADTDIPWTYSAGTVTFKSTIDGSGDGLHLHGHWALTGTVDGTTSLDTELHIGLGGILRTQSYNASFHTVTNAGRLEVASGSRLTLDGANSTSTGTLVVRDGGLRLKKSGGLSLTIENGVCELVRAELDVDTGDPSSIIVDSASSSLAVLSCQGSSFSKIGLVVETDGIVAAFDDTSFDDGISTRHIYWKTTDERSVSVMRNIRFNHAFGGGSYNVQTDGTPVNLRMIGCGGVRTGAGYESDPNNRVEWDLTPPRGLRVLVGDTRLRLEWEASDQASLADTGYNVYRTTNPADSLPWGGPLNGGTPVTDTFYNDSSLSNGTTYYYYVTFIDTNPDPDAQSNGSNRASAAPAAASIDALSPEEGPATSVLALSVFGSNTHWDSSTSTTITKGGGSNLTVNDTVVISASLILVDATLSGATTGTWTVTTTASDVWGIGAYDEIETDDFTVAAIDADESDRPTLAFSTSNGGIAENANTSGSFTLNVDFTDQGNGIDTTEFEVYASRDVTISSGNVTAGTELRGAGLSIDTLNDSRATWTINQSAGTELFANGQYSVYVRVKDDDGYWSDFVARTFFVEGANANVLKCTDLLLQGSTIDVTVTGSSLSSTQTISFGSDITVNSASGSGSSITVNVTVGNLAAAGPRTITTNNGSKSGIAVVQWPTNILPTVTNAEPSRNPAVAGVNVFLKNGAFFKSETDIATRGRMMGMSWSRFYRSDITYNGPLGHNWVGHQYQWALYSSPGEGVHQVKWNTPDGRQETFTMSGAAGVNSTTPAGVYVSVVRETTHNTITLTDRHGHRCVFNRDGRLWKCIDRNGNTTECIYNSLGQLVEITDDRGATWEIEYYSHGRVHKVIDKVWDAGSPREIEYVYDSNGDLTQQKAPATARYDGTPLPRITYGYGYDSSHRLTRCINPREFAESGNPVPYLENFYDSTGRVVDQQLGSEADVIDHHITKSAFIRLRYESGTLIRELDRNGLRTDYTIDASGRTTDIKRYTGFWSVDTEYPYTHSTVASVLAKLRSSDPSYFQTVLTYNSNHEVLTVTYPRGNKITYAYPNGASQVSATADSCSGAVLTDSSESWTTDAFKGMTLRMGTSAANYRYYPIASNTSTTITVATGFDLQADGWNASAYAVYSQSIDPLAGGNVLTVTRSDEGLGGLSDIVTNYTFEPRYQFVKTVSDPRNSAWLTTYIYDYEESAANGADAGNLVKVETPTITGSMAGSSTIVSRTTYNQYGQPVASIDGEGNVTRLEYYSSGDNEGFLKLRISAWGELNLTSEYAYDKVGNLTASWPPRAFEAGVTKDDFKFAAEVNELNQTWHTTSKVEVGTSGALTLVSIDTYNYFDANGNRTHSFHEYITAAGTSPSAPGEVLDPASFSKASTAMAATWVESSATYNLLNYTVTSTRDAIAGSAITQFTTRVEYDSNYNTLAAITPLGNRTRTVFDERDMVYRRIPGANSDVQATFEVDYDTNGNTLRSRDALGNQTTNVYDGFDRLTKTTDPAGHYREVDYDAASNTTESRAYDKFALLLAKGQTTFDEINRAYTSRRMANDHNGVPIGDGWSTSTTVFDKNSRVVSSTNDNGVTHYMFYDGASRTTFTRDAVGNETHFVYNANGATTRVNYREINGLNNAVEISHTENILTKQDSVVEHRDRRYTAGTFDTSTSVKYDGWGRVTESYDAADNTVTTNFDLLSRATDSTEEAGTDDIFTLFTYDDDSRVITRAIKRNPGAATFQETTYEYDERGRLITLRRPDAGTTGDIWTYQYDANGNRIGWTDPLGTAVTNTYDARNLLAYRHINRGTGVKGATYESYEFDGLGRLQSCSNYEGANLISASAWAYNTLSAPERHDQTVADYEGDILNTWTTMARYDGSGFNTATIYSDGRTVRHYPDALNRLLESYDEDAHQSVAMYLYAGPNRLIERTYGNGARTVYEYEKSGCGCGGSTSFCDAVEHKDASTGRVLWATRRKHDVRGLVMYESRDHEGALTSVFRYDEASRLTKTWYGVNPFDGFGVSQLPDLRNPANDPNSESMPYGLRRNYDLDPRGNRTSVKDYDDDGTPTEIYDYSYTANTDTNQYTAVDGANYTFDAIEQMTHDPTRGIYMAYNYQGLLVLEDNDSDFTTPERRYGHDNQGRLRYEGRFYEASYHPFDIFCYTYCPTCTTCGCQNPGAPILEAHNLDGAGAADYSIQSVFGPGAHGSLSGSAVNPFVGGFVQGGTMHGPVRVQERLIDGETTKVSWRHEDQLGSLIGMTDAGGLKIDEYVYTDYGRPARRPILLDLPDSEIHDVQEVPSTPFSRIYTTDTLLPQTTHRGRALAVAAPGDGDNNWNVTVVTDTGTELIGEVTYGYIEIVDGEGAVCAAMNDNDLGCVIYDFWDLGEYASADYHTFGDWLSVTYIGGNDETEFEDADHDFQPFMQGWLLVPEAQKLGLLEITEVDAANDLVITKGDAAGMAGTGGRYWIIPPAGVNSVTGAIETDPCRMGSLWLWAGYHYRAPIAGFHVDPEGEPTLGIYGKQNGSNQAGTYECWNRVYEPQTGRWTTPDPAAQFANLFDYGSIRPTSIGDPTGMFSMVPSDAPTDWNNPPTGPAPDLGAIDRLVHGGGAGFNPDDHYHGKGFSSKAGGKPGLVRQQVVNRLRDSILRPALLERLDEALRKLKILSKRLDYDYDKHYKPYGEGVDDNTPTRDLVSRVSRAECEADKEEQRFKDKYEELYGHPDPFYEDRPVKGESPHDYARKKGCTWDWYCVHQVQIKYSVGATYDALCEIWCEGAKEAATHPGKGPTLPFYAEKCAACSMAGMGLDWWDNYSFQKCCK